MGSTSPPALQAALPSSSPEPFQTPELGTVSPPHVPPVIQASGLGPSIPLIPLDYQGFERLASSLPSPLPCPHPQGKPGEATINASLFVPHYRSISVGLTLDELPPSLLGDWRW